MFIHLSEDCLIDFNQIIIYAKDEKYELTEMQSKILKKLVINKGKYVPYEVLADDYYGIEGSTENEIGNIRTVISDIRKIYPEVMNKAIKTKRGIGYMFDDLQCDNKISDEDIKSNHTVKHRKITFDLNDIKIWCDPPDADRHILNYSMLGDKLDSVEMKVDFSKNDKNLSVFYSAVFHISASDWMEYYKKGYKLFVSITGENLSRIDVELQTIKHDVIRLKNNMLLNNKKNFQIFELDPIINYHNNEGKVLIDRICFVYFPKNHGRIEGADFVSLFIKGAYLE